jgi:hypothetical protein
MAYFAAFEHTTGIYEGTRFWSCFESKEQFEQKECNPAHTVVAHGEDQNEIQAIALDYDPAKHFDVALGKTEERRQKALARFKKTGDRKQFVQDLRNVEELHKYEMLSAQLCQIEDELTRERDYEANRK